MIKAAALVAVALVACSDRDPSSSAPRKTPFYFESSTADSVIELAYSRAGSRPVNSIILYRVKSDGTFADRRAWFEVQLFGDPDLSKPDACTLLHASREKMEMEENAVCVRGHQVIPRPRCSVRDQIRRAGLAEAEATDISISLWREGDPPRTRWRLQEMGRPYYVPDDCLPVVEQP